MRFAIDVFMFNYLATDQRICNEELHFVRLMAILAGTVKNANQTRSDASGWYQIGTKSRSGI